MDALDAANCTSILDKFPQREMTVIGAKGVYLSGGEVQRIAIARAILKNANIVIMDEASAAADPENEYELQQAFQKLMRGKTVIMIAVYYFLVICNKNIRLVFFSYFRIVVDFCFYGIFICDCSVR